MTYSVKTQAFEGPLDLLLHLPIRERRATYAADRELVRKIVGGGMEKARVIAKKTMEEEMRLGYSTHTKNGEKTSLFFDISLSL